MIPSAEFVVTFSIRKGLGPEHFIKRIFIFYDDLDPEYEDKKLLEDAKRDAESQLYKSEDFRHYGKNWELLEIDRIQ